MMLEQMKRLVVEEEGQALTEYGLIIALVAVAVIAAVTLLGDQIEAVFNQITDGLGGDSVNKTTGTLE
jgi:pilus assembly protein Flp/PilA